MCINVYISACICLIPSKLWLESTGRDNRPIVCIYAARAHEGFALSLSLGRMKFERGMPVERERERERKNEREAEGSENANMLIFLVCV